MYVICIHTHMYRDMNTHVNNTRVSRVTVRATRYLPPDGHVLVIPASFLPPCGSFQAPALALAVNHEPVLRTRATLHVHAYFHIFLQLKFLHVLQKIFAANLCWHYYTSYTCY